MPSLGASEAPPTMEALSASFADTPTSLVVTLELATVDEAFPGAVSRDASTSAANGAIYTVCWTTAPEPCIESVVLGAIPDALGAPQLLSFYRVESTACNDHATCAWRVPATLETGAPGRIVWDIPRAVLANTTAGTTLAGPKLTVERYFAPSGRATWPSEDGLGYGVGGPSTAETEENGVPTGGWGYTGNHLYVVDESDPGRDYTLVSTPAAVDIETRFDVHADLVGDVVGPARDDLDVISTQLVETDENLTVATQVARVDEAALDHYFFGGLGLGSGRYYTFGYGVSDDQIRPYADVCAVPNCHDMPVPDVRTIPVDFEFIPGAPGWINATFARVDLGYPPRGDIVNYLDVTMFTYDETATRSTAQAADDLPLRPPVRAAVVSSGSTDTHAIAPPWWFRLDTIRTLNTMGFSLLDELGDVDTSGDSLVADQKNRFDITYLEAYGRSSTMSRITLGIADLGGALEAPVGYRGFTYVIGLQLADGTNRMVGFYYEENPTGPPLQDYFCADDTAVFSAAPRDPATVAWTKIQGVISAATAIDTTGAGQRGSLTFQVPHDACFLQEEPGAIPIQAIAARTYLLPVDEALASAQGLRALDTAESDQGFTLHATEIIPPGPPWYAEPFGIASFWDIFGITVVPLITLLIGFFALRRRRLILERYLKLIDETIVANEGKPKELEAALMKIRQKLKDDLVSDRIQHAHFTIADKRIEEARGKARVGNIADAFEELPHRLLRRLEELLADGLMTREDYRVFSALLEEAPLTPDARASIRRKLLIWVREDAEEAKTRTVPIETGPGDAAKRPATLN